MTFFAGLFFLIIQSFGAQIPPTPQTQHSYYASDYNASTDSYVASGADCDTAQTICKAKCKDYPNLDKETCKAMKKAACDYHKEECKHQEVPLPILVDILLFISFIFLFYRLYFSAIKTNF